MPRIPSIAITTGLIGPGVLAWALAGRPLIADSDLKAPLNPLGINHSPYGEVFAMAMQGPIDTESVFGMFGASAHRHQEAAPECQAVVKTESGKKIQTANLSLTSHLRKMIARMEKGAEERTNPKPASNALKFYLRRQAEDKLRFAYQLDPSHYANYNALHFFLVEGVTTHPELVSSAGQLADETIQYCLQQENDPRPALTAAAACTNMLHLMFADHRGQTPKFTTQQMRGYLDLLDQCIARYDRIAREWDESHNWERLSNLRITECQDRISFISRIRDAAEMAIIRIEGESLHHQASN